MPICLKRRGRVIIAERRMFSKSVVESDPFMDMPAEAQALYFHLNMAADDDGFCDNPRSIMRQCGAGNDTMKLLIAKKFVLTFEKNDGFVVVVKHWRLNNYIRKDTYHETKYKEFMRELYFDENQSYSTNPGDGHVPCLPQPRNEPVTAPSRNRDDSLTQDRLGKDSKGKSIVSVGKDRIGKGESEGENPPPPPAEQKPTPPPAESSGGLAIQQRANKVQIYAKRIAWMRQEHYDPVRMYKLAAAEGITADEIDVAILGLDSV